MRRRSETLFLKVMRNTAMAGVMIMLLFAGMTYSLWTLLDGNRVLSKVVLIGRLAPVEESALSYRSLNEGEGIPAYLTVYEGDLLKESLRPRDELTIVFPGMGSGEAIRATFVEYSQSPVLDKRQGHTLVVQVVPEEGTRREFLSKIVSQETALSMEVSFRGKKLWQAAVEKMPL